MLCMPCLQPSSITHQPIPPAQGAQDKPPAGQDSPHNYLPAGFEQVPGMLQTFLTSPVENLIPGPNQRAGCHHQSAMLWTLQ